MPPCCSAPCCSASLPLCLPAAVPPPTAGGCSFLKQESKQALLSLEDNSLNLHKLKYHLKIKHNKGLEVKADQVRIWKELHLSWCVSNSMTPASDLGLHSATLQAYRRAVMPAKDATCHLSVSSLLWWPSRHTLLSSLSPQGWIDDLA